MLFKIKENLHFLNFRSVIFSNNSCKSFFPSSTKFCAWMMRSLNVFANIVPQQIRLQNKLCFIYIICFGCFLYRVSLFPWLVHNFCLFAHKFSQWISSLFYVWWQNSKKSRNDIAKFIIIFIMYLFTNVIEHKTFMPGVNGLLEIHFYCGFVLYSITT